MCFNGQCKKEENKSVLGKIFVTAAAAIGFGTLIYLAVKYLFNKYRNNCCDLCYDDDDEYGCDECGCGFGGDDDCCACGEEIRDDEKTNAADDELDENQY